MNSTTRFKRWFPSFRRSLAFLRPHRRPLIRGLLAAVGVSVFYTFSISSVVPILKILFSDHETLIDWLHRAETQRRLGVILAADLPDDPTGLRIDGVREGSPSAEALRDAVRIASIEEHAPGSYGLMQRLSSQRSDQITGVRIITREGQQRDVTLSLREYHGWWGLLRDAAALLPAGRDPASRLRTLGLVMAVLVTVSLLGSVCRFANEALVATAVQRSMHDLRSSLADHVLRLPLHWYSSQPTGDTLSRFSHDLGKVEVGIWTLLGKTVREPLKAVGVLTLTVLIEWRLLVVALVGIPIAWLVIRTFGRLVKRAQRRASKSLGRLLDHLNERIGGVRVVKAYNMQSAESRRFEHEGRTLTRAQTRIELVDAATKPSLETLAMLAVGIFVIYGGNRVFQGQIEPHLFFAAVVCLGGMFDPIRKLGNVNNRLQAAEASAQRVFELMDLRTEEPAKPREEALALPAFEDAIEFCGVGFAYPSSPERAVLKDVCLRIEKGRTVALVGPNGSGKTTLISLLLRFYEPGTGRILIDGRDIAGVSLESLRAQIGLVTQDAVVFSDTVRANIAYGANGVTDETIVRAARLAHIDDFVSGLEIEHEGELTRGFDARVSARTLSGGQRQRIALARAILRDPPILILDEATSQVDSESERRIQEAFDDVMRGRTTFIIAHRFSTIRRADLIVVLNEGRIVGVGPHEELCETCPIYVTLCETQFASAIQSPTPENAPRNPTPNPTPKR